MRPSSAKAKGRGAQQWLALRLLRIAKIIAPDVDIQPDDIRSTAMGQSGADIQLSTAARKLFNFDFEVKQVESLNIWAAIDQAINNTNKGMTAVVFAKNNRERWIAVKFSDFEKLVWGIDEAF